MKKKLFYIWCLLLLLFVVLVNPVLSAPSDIGDLGIYPKPPAPTLPSAGSSYIDPTFGTTILRVTDRTMGDSFTINYSNYSALNSDNTRIIVKKAGVGNPKLYSFDANTMTSSEIGPLFTTTTGDLEVGGITWSHSDPDLLYGTSKGGTNSKLWSYAPSTDTWTLIKDFGATGTGDFTSPPFVRNNILYLSVSEDDVWLSFIVGHLNQTGTHTVGVYNRVTDTLYKHDFSGEIDGDELHAAIIDQTGTYVFLNRSGSSLKYIWNIVPDTVEVLTAGSPDWAGGHRCYGKKTYICTDVDDPYGFVIRSLDNPHSFKKVFDHPAGYDFVGGGTHYSLNHSDDTWFVVSRYFGSVQTISAAYQEEIFQVFTDGGTTKTKRLAHHRSTGIDYASQPHATTSYDGKFIAYSSDWDGSGYIDVFILKVDIVSSDTTPPAPPVGLKIQ